MLPPVVVARARLGALGRRLQLETSSRVLAVRSFASTGFPKKQGLYDPAQEKDSCGVGLVASLKGEQTRQIVLDCNEMLVRMSHRGGCGCDPASGDGAGMLVGMPDEFMRARVLAEMGIELPPLGEYAVGQCFLPADEALANDARASMERISRQRGLKVLGWRVLKTDNSELGASPISTEPRSEQLLLKRPSGWDERHYEQELYRVQRYAELEMAQVAEEKQLSETQQAYICSMSPWLITFKGQLTPEQVMGYFSADLGHEDFKTNIALVHSRFSTNTFPSWSRAQPLRMMCHNGEINTLRGNKNWMRARGGLLRSDYYGDSTAQLLPVVSDDMSDSGNFDSVMQLLQNASKRSLPEIAMMMVPEAWQDNDSLSASKKAFYEYNSCLMEPWDGPALIAFTDARRYIGATLDRNGLRPARYYVTSDDVVLLSSEVGVLPSVVQGEVVKKSRLEPGKMFLIDMKEGRIVPDNEIKEEVAKKLPYADWLAQKREFLEDWAKDKKPTVQAHDFFSDATVSRRLVMHGYTTETMETLLAPMAIGGKEGLGSMGNDAAIAVLSKEARPVFDYFKQLFAQVTNPPIDPIREELVMSLSCPVGPESNLLDPGPENCAKLIVEHPLLTLKDLAALTDAHGEAWRTTTLDATFLPPVTPEETGIKGETALETALLNLCERVSEAIQGDYDEQGASIIVLSDALAGPERLPIPSLLAVGAVHQHLLRTNQRGGAALFVDCGDAREVHDMSLLVGYGADGICPRVAYEAVSKLRADGLVAAKLRNVIASPDEAPSDEVLIAAYRNSIAKGMLKVMSKMGISTLQSYKGAQIFEALGLHSSVVDLCFAGTPSRIGGAGFEALQADILSRHSQAWQGADSASSPVLLTKLAPTLPNPGQFHYRDGGEKHLNTPASMVHLQAAARNNSREAFDAYSAEVNESNAACTLRGMLRWKAEAVASGTSKKLTIDDIEPVQAIVKRFVTGAMSLGSISQETHESLAVAMNTIGGRSNTGEGGEDPKRFNDNRRSAIKQVASGRFGVTSHYLANSDQIQIKMAQGAKPGEGGELPGHKVSNYIAECRGTTPGVGLISPPPHHDIYSIEDLAQLIHDLKCANPEGDVSVKLVSEVGVGVVAAGVAKAKADHIVVSGGDGGTGAAAWTGVKAAGLPWELGVAETQQTLVLNGLRDRIRLQTDGQIKTARDVAIACALGAEEFAFSTGPLIALGCIMMRKCHLNTCPVGIATQDPELRKMFKGKPEHVINFFWLLAEDLRAILLKLGMKSMDELVGAAGDVLEVDPRALRKSGRPDKTRGLDLAPLLQPGHELNPHAGVRHLDTQDHELDIKADNVLIEQARGLIEAFSADPASIPDPLTIKHNTTNLDRTLGTMLSSLVSKKCGKDGLPEESLRIELSGSSGQSLGFALAKGITIEVRGDANDGCGKGLSGGRIIVIPPDDAHTDFISEENVVVGNVACYGATSGEAFFRGVAGERFCVRNSGALAVVEGTGDHACEYMTGGRVVVLGETGRNFGAGMSGGVAYVYDPKGVFPERVNMGMVELGGIKTQAERDELKAHVESHLSRTDSPLAKRILDNWANELPAFVRVMPVDYKKVLYPHGEEDEAIAA